MKKYHHIFCYRIINQNMSIRKNIILILQRDHPLLQEKECSPVQQELSQERVDSSDKTLGEVSCNCQKTGCVKLYCSCFKEGKECSEDCSCLGCRNQQDQPERAQAILKMIRKYKNNFVQKFERNSDLGCNCKRSKCQQKYCECYIRNQSCNETCKCKKCKNGKIDQKKCHPSQSKKKEENKTNNCPKVVQIISSFAQFSV